MGPVDDIDEEVKKCEGMMAWLKIRIAELEEQAASLPTVGFHRPAFKETRRMLKHVRQALEDEREYREWLDEERKWEAEMQATMSPEQIASWKEFEKEQDQKWREHDRRVKEAEKRRAAFRLIDGGKQ